MSTTSSAFVRGSFIESRRPPRTSVGVIGWAIRPGASYRDHAAIPFKHDDRKDRA